MKGGPYPTGLARSRFGAAANEDDTARILREAERRSERLIAVVRVVVSIALYAVFGLAVADTAPIGDLVLARQLDLAVATIAVYELLGIASFMLTAQRFYHPSFLFVFAALDVVFVLVSVRFALLNTGASANYAWAMPSMWLIPMVLAFGAMRLSPALQAFGAVLLLAGLAMLGWQIDGVPYAFDEAPSGIATYFADPPNTMRIVMIGLGAAILVATGVRTRLLLKSALAEERRAARLTKYMPPEVARLVNQRSAKDLAEGRNQTVVVLFADIRDFTARTEGMAPEAVSAFLARYRSELRQAAEETGGVLDKFVGDGAMAIFGIPEPAKDDADRAIAFALSVAERMARWSDALAQEGAVPIRVGIGIHLGPAFVGAVGDERRLEFTVLGDTVNVAARLEEATKATATGILVSDAVRAASTTASDRFEAVGALAIRGHTNPIAAHVLKSGAPAT